MFLAVSLAFAAASCPDAADPSALGDADVGPDGAAHVLVYDSEVACWWIVDEVGDARVAGRFEGSSHRPMRVEALEDGRALFVMDDLTVQVRAENGAQTTLPMFLPSFPDRTLAHPTAPVVAFEFAIDADYSMIWLVDVNRGAIVASASVPSMGVAFQFEANLDGVVIQGARTLILDADGVRPRPQSRR